MTHQTPGRPLRILLADDDPDSRLLCKRVLEGFGHVVMTAEDGLQALTLLREHPWDVILTDQNMPGATGIDVLERAFEQQPDALRLLMSTIIDPRTKEEAITRARAQAFIQKPLAARAFSVLVGREPAEFEVRYAEG